MKSILVYNKSCKFCTELARWSRNFVGPDKLKICSNKEIIISCGSHDIPKSVIEKDVHFLGPGRHLYSRGSAIAHVLALKKNFAWIGHWNDKSSIIRMGFETVYFILKQIKVFYNNLNFK